jgi:hypothetical protein
VALVKSTNSDILTGPSDPPGADLTARLLLALTTLYVQRPTHTAEEQQQYVELALRLIDKVEAATRAAVGGILQRHTHAPVEVLERLSGIQSSRDGEPRSEPHSALYQHSTSDRHPADGERASTPASSDTTPATQQLAPITSEFAEAFFEAPPAERRRRLSLIARGRSGDIQAAPQDGGPSYEGLDVAALHGRIGEFTREFQRLIDIPESLCERILNDPTGEPMAIAAKATGIPIAILQRILLLASPAVSHSVQRVYELTEIYHSLDGAAAGELLAQWRTRAKRNDQPPDTGPASGNRRPGALRDSSVASMRSRFCALTERLQGRPFNARSGPGNVARRGLRSR